MSDPPAFYDDLDKTEGEAWRLLVDGVQDRNSPFHTVSVASVSVDGNPRVRQVVLRGVDARARRFRFHTDVRSSKIAEFEASPAVALLFFGTREKIQIRIEGRASVHRTDALADEAWLATRPDSRVCYRVLQGPGEVLDEPRDATWRDAGPEGNGGRDVFCAVTVDASALEWLYLHHAGHRRARFSYDGQTRAEWLVP